MREWGTASAEAATAGANLAMGLDTFENRRCGNAESRENSGINKWLVEMKSSAFADGIFDMNQPLPRKDCPEGFAASRKIKKILIHKRRRQFGGNNFDRNVGYTLEEAGASRNDSRGRNYTDVWHKAISLVYPEDRVAQYSECWTLKRPRGQRPIHIAFCNFTGVPVRYLADNLIQRRGCPHVLIVSPLAASSGGD